MTQISKEKIKAAVKKALIETTKFGARMFILIVVPILVSESANLTGAAGDIVGKALPIVLPLLDRYIHTNDNINSNGLIPF